MLVRSLAGYGRPGSTQIICWRIARQQHGLITRAQLLELGYTRHAIRHRVSTGRLHPIHRGVSLWADQSWTCRVGAWQRCSPVGRSPWSATKPRPSCGAFVLLVGVPLRSRSRRRSIEPFTASVFTAAVRSSRANCKDALGIPITSPMRTLVDLATRLESRPLEAAINEADKLDLIDPETLRLGLDEMRWQRGVPALRRVLDRRTFRLTDSELERIFLRLVRAIGLPTPRTGVWVNGFRVDFFWPELGLVVETDGLRYHRTPAQQVRDRRRDQVHTAAGLTTLRFTHAQVRFEAAEVREVLLQVAARLARRAAA